MMGKFNIFRTFVYKWRYPISYGSVLLALIFALLFAGTYIPGGLSAAEIESATKSSSTMLSHVWTIDVINLPYHILQHASLSIFGVSVLSIKLPSIILAFMSAVGMTILLKQWFKPGIGILASLIAITTGQFLFIAQNGTPDILYLFWPVWLILTASLIPVHEKWRKLYIVAFFALAALSLYTPLSLYILVVIAGAIIIHPHLRFLIKQLTKLELLIGVVVIGIVIAPLVFAISKAPELAAQLMGWPASIPNLMSNTVLLANRYLGFADAGKGTTLTPFFELGSTLLIVLGAYYIYKNRATAKSYVVTLWTLCLIPVIVLNPPLISVTFLPLVLLLASGINGLLSHWYGLFPRNPYARIGGLIPIIILVTVLLVSGISRYVYGYTYDPNIVTSFSRDLRLLPKNTTNLVVSEEELSFYNVVAKYNHKIRVSVTPTSSWFLATHDAKRTFYGYQIDHIVTSSDTNNSDRFYLYKKSSL
ncbi:glycosyltransferase family 39 protein [Candidatus Saccharibacteria bacterium]|nr:glycosyltransferase family 39 protein [Candidatus Saccharibacteria bacterium]